MVSLTDIELVHFERVSFQLKNFDVVFIFKDYSKKVAMINSVAMSSLDDVKEWLKWVGLKKDFFGPLFLSDMMYSEYIVLQYGSIQT